MKHVDIAKTFAASFKQGASETAATTFSSSIRFIAVMLVLLAVIWCVNQFLSNTEKEQEGFLIVLGSRLVRIVIGSCVFILLLIVKGNTV